MPAFLSHPSTRPTIAELLPGSDDAGESAGTLLMSRDLRFLLCSGCAGAAISPFCRPWRRAGLACQLKVDVRRMTPAA
jgi:hypothetical protein